FGFVNGSVGPGLAVALHGLGVRRRVVVIAFARRDGVNRLDDAPPFAGFNQRILHDVAGVQLDVLAFERLASGRRSDALDHRYLAALFVARLDLGQILRHGDDLARVTSRPGGWVCKGQGRRLLNGAVAIDAIDLNRGSRLVIDVAVAVDVRADVTIGA